MNTNIEQEYYKGSLCIYCYDTGLWDFTYNLTGSYAHCACNFEISYSKKTKDKLLPVFEDCITNMIIKYLR
jgi:hypothetical protein